MLIISEEIMTTIDKKERCDTKCFVMRWSNSKVKLRQEKKLIISVRDNGNNRWNRNAKKKKQKKKQKQRQKNNGDRSCNERGRAK